MVWLSIDERYDEYIFEEKPYKDKYGRCGIDNSVESEYFFDTLVELPNGMIEKLIGRKLTFQDEPVNLYEYNDLQRRQGQ